MKKIILFLLQIIIFSGCGIWGDFVTYFNLYYNTKSLFEEAETAIYAEKTSLFNIQPQNIPGSANQKLTSVIEKASKILQFHPNSAYVDDALLMLGKSFYYQKNYQKALRKFQELIATQPDSDLRLETELWIGKSEMNLKNYNTALETLSEVRKKAIEEDENEIAINSYVEEIKYYLVEENYASAISNFSQLLEVSDDDQLNAEIALALGKLYQENNELENAIASFKRVNEYSPSYENEYEAEIELAKTLRKMGKSEEAIEILDDMRSQDKYSEYFAKIELQQGITLFELGENDEAIDLLMMVDTAYARTPSSSEAQFKLGQIYEDEYQNFDSAMVYYQKTLNGQLPAEDYKTANEKVQMFKKFQNLQSSIEENRKKLIYTLDPKKFVQDSIDFYEEYFQQQENTAIDYLSFEDERRRIGRGRGIVPQVTQNRNKTGQDAAVKSPPVRPDIPIDSIEQNLVRSYYEIGNMFFTEFNILDSAQYYYKKILENYPNSPYTARTLFSLGSYYEADEQAKKADSLFNIIYDNYKNESIVNAAANKLNKPIIDLEYDPAKELYLSAEEQLLNEDYKKSLTNFYDIYKNYPSSPMAPKALYTSGWILENKLNMYDSAAAVYDSVVTKYPQTIYASNVRFKVTSYKTEKERIRKIESDSLLKVEQRKDSILNAEKIRLDSISAANSTQNERKLSSGTVASDTTRMFEQLSSDSLVDTIRDASRDAIRKIDELNSEPYNGRYTDSLGRTPLEIDSLRRDRGSDIDPMQQNLEIKVDSLTPGKSKPPLEP